MRVKNQLKLCEVYDGFLNMREMEEIVNTMTKPVSNEPLKISMSTRWNSVQRMLKSAKKNAKAANIALSNLDKCSVRIWGSDTDNIDLLIKVFDAFVESSQSLQSTSQGTIFTVALIKTSLVKHLKDIREDLLKDGRSEDSMILKVIKSLSENINGRMQIQEFHKLSSLLDPSNIVLDFSKAMPKSEKTIFIEKWFRRLFEDELEETRASPIEEQTSKPSIRGKLLDNLNFDQEVEINDFSNNNLKSEITKLLSEKPSKVDFKIWWINKKDEYPYLFKLANAVHGIPASSAFSESCFSVASTIASEQKSNTNFRNVEQICFCRINKKLITRLRD